MTLVRFNPMKELLEVEREFSKLFNDFDRRLGFGYKGERNEEYEDASWSPLTDIYEDENNFKLKLDLPGVKKEDVKISFSNGEISIAGERKQEMDTENSKYHRVERIHGKFYRAFNLPKEINEEKISAEFTNGQLIVVIPKSEKAKPKQIEVHVN